MRVKKGVILAAGLNSRMAPISKVIPKVMLPIDEKPVAHYLVEECLAAGVREIAFIVSEKNSLVEKYFDRKGKALKLLKRYAKESVKKKLKIFDKKFNVRFIVQEKPLGEAHALFQAKNFVGKQPFAVLFGDTLYKAKKNPLKQLIEKFRKNNFELNIFGCDGRFIFLPSVFSVLEKTSFKNKPNLQTIFRKNPLKKKFRKYRVNGKKFNVGNPSAYYQAFIELSKK